MILAKKWIYFGFSWKLIKGPRKRFWIFFGFFLDFFWIFFGFFLDFIWIFSYFYFGPRTWFSWIFFGFFLDFSLLTKYILLLSEHLTPFSYVIHSEQLFWQRLRLLSCLVHRSGGDHALFSKTPASRRFLFTYRDRLVWFPPRTSRPAAVIVYSLAPSCSLASRHPRFVVVP